MWFTEDAWSPIILCLVACVIFFIAWSSTRKSKLLLAIPLLILAAITIFFVEQAIETPLEKLETTLVDLVDTFVEESQSIQPAANMNEADVAARARSDDYFAEENEDDRKRVIRALLLVQVSDDVSVKDIDLNVTDDTQATSRFRVNGTVMAGSFSGHRVSYWEMHWKMTPDGWKITRTIMLDPVNGDEKPIPRVD